MQGDGDALPLLVFGERLVRAFVVRQGLLESILTMEDVSHVVLKTCDVPGLTEAREDFPGTFRGLEGTVVFPKQDERLDGAT